MEYERGDRFLNPCVEEDDHERHWITQTDGTLEPVTLTGMYTIDHLMLWRDLMVYHRTRCLRWQNESVSLQQLLDTRNVNIKQRTVLEQRLGDLQELIEPPVFSRAHCPLSAPP